MDPIHITHYCVCIVCVTSTELLWIWASEGTCDPSLLPAYFTVNTHQLQRKNWINLCCIICDLYLSIQVNTWAHAVNPSPGKLSEAVFLRLSRHNVCLQKNLVMNRAALFKRCYSATGEMERIFFLVSGAGNCPFLVQLSFHDQCY